MKKMPKLLLALMLCASGLFLTACDMEEALGFAITESGGEYEVTDQFKNTLVFSRDQAEALADLEPEKAQAFLDARFRSKFPSSYLDPETELRITEQNRNPVEVAYSPAVTAAANLPGAIAPGGGTAVSVALNGLLGLGLLGYRHFKLKQLSRKDAALNGFGRLIDGVYNVAEVMPDKEQGKKIVKAVDSGLELATEVQGAIEEIKAAVKRTETPTIDAKVYE
jgi:hypothetical protein